MSDISVIIPIYNARAWADRQISSLRCQTLQPAKVIIIDSQSMDGSTDLYRAAGYDIVSIDARNFDHGATRNLGLHHSDTATVIYLTHDAILHGPLAFERLCAPFADSSVGAVYGRQLPRAEAGAIERHGRLFNYSATSQWRQWPRDHHLGFRALFCSNAFAAYRRGALEQIGGFPEQIIFGEDEVAVGRILLSRWTVVYAGDAEVEHSHGYSLLNEFRRYFDVGVFAKANRSLFEHFGTISGEGRRFVVSELSYLLRHSPHCIPEAGLRTIMKLLGYHLGKREMMLPHWMKLQLAMNRAFYERNPSPLSVEWSDGMVR